MRRFLGMLFALAAVLLGGCGIFMADEPGGRSESTQMTEAQLPDPDIVPYRQLRYFFGQLDSQALYNACAIYESAMNFESECALPYPMAPAGLQKLIVLLRYECPELLQLDFTQSFSYGTVNEQVVEVNLPLVLDEQTYNAQLEACEAVIETVAAQAKDLSDPEKEAFVYEYIAKNCVYTTQSLNCGTAYGCLVEGKAKCDGISFAMKWIMEELGIRCLVLSGDPVDGTVGHAWNVVELDGAFYDVDVTADVPHAAPTGELQYPAYNVNDSWIRQYYIVDPAYSAFGQIPGSDTMGQSYHAQHSSFVAAGEDAGLEDRFLDAYARKGSFTVQFESGSDYESFMNTLEDAIRQIAEANDLPGYRLESQTTAEYHIVTVHVSEY